MNPAQQINHCADLSDEFADEAIKVEERLVRSGALKPLTSTTSPQVWDAYWQRVLDVTIEKVGDPR